MGSPSFHFSLILIDSLFFVNKHPIFLHALFFGLTFFFICFLAHYFALFVHYSLFRQLLPNPHINFKMVRISLHHMIM